MTLTRWDPVWAPAVDILEKGDELVIHAEVPGVKREDIDIRVENNTLVLRGERRENAEVDGGTAFRRERLYGAFTRRFSLPAIVNAGAIQARYRDGILEIALPKSEEAKPRRIEIGS